MLLTYSYQSQSVIYLVFSIQNICRITYDPNHTEDQTATFCASLYLAELLMLHSKQECKNGSVPTLHCSWPLGFHAKLILTSVIIVFAPQSVYQSLGMRLQLRSRPVNALALYRP